MLIGACFGVLFEVAEKYFWRGVIFLLAVLFFDPRSICRQPDVVENSEGAFNDLFDPRISFLHAFAP